MISLLLSACQTVYPPSNDDDMDVSCYDNGTLMYRGAARNVKYGFDYIIFDEARTNKKVFIAGNCMVRFKQDWKAKRDKLFEIVK